ncbi:hypothetical protein [Sinomonas halotolerans]|uniref:Uncharacterized protein n=1 Tax=Sinomonas halotolerans TaxID=1644133 RepID=A0ABU9X060_9MICC
MAAPPRPRFRPLRPSARASLWSAGATAILGFVTFLTLDAGSATLTLVSAGVFVACSLYAVLAMRRYVAAGTAAAGTALALGAGLAFLRVLGIAWDQSPEAVATVSTRDADPYFLGSVLAVCLTLAVLFAGAVWPEQRALRSTPSRAPRAPRARAARAPGPKSAAAPRPRTGVAPRASRQGTAAAAPARTRANAPVSAASRGARRSG